MIHLLITVTIGSVVRFRCPQARLCILFRLQIHKVMVKQHPLDAQESAQRMHITSISPSHAHTMIQLHLKFFSQHFSQAIISVAYGNSHGGWFVRKTTSIDLACRIEVDILIQLPYSSSTRSRSPSPSHSLNLQLLYTFVCLKPIILIDNFFRNFSTTSCVLVVLNIFTFNFYLNCEWVLSTIVYVEPSSYLKPLYSLLCKGVSCHFLCFFLKLSIPPYVPIERNLADIATCSCPGFSRDMFLLSESAVLQHIRSKVGVVRGHKQFSRDVQQRIRPLLKVHLCDVSVNRDPEESHVDLNLSLLWRALLIMQAPPTPSQYRAHFMNVMLTPGLQSVS